MAHVLKLGFKQNPTIGVDDCIDFGGSGNTISGSLRPGYYLQSYTEGPSRTDSFGRLVRDLTIVCEIRGASVADAHFKFTEINRYLQRTRMYFEHYNGNIPAQTDLQWHTGRAATLTFQAQGGLTMVYWDVLDGLATLPSNVFLAAENNSNFAITGVTVKITCNYTNRQAAVILDNLAPLSDFEPPFVLTPTSGNYFSGGWTATSGIAFDTTTAKFGTRSLKWNGAVAYDLYSPVNLFMPEACTIVVSAWVKGTVTGAGGHFHLGYFINGSTTIDFGTINGTTTISNWTQYSSAPLSLNAGDSIQIHIWSTTTGGASFSMNVDGVGVWRNPVGGVAPSEFFSAGRSSLVPIANVYGIRGDVEAPFVMALNYHVTSSSNYPRYFLLGMMPIKQGVDYPLFGLDLQTAAGSTDNAMFWRTQVTGVTGSPLSGTSSFPITGPSIGHVVSGRPRKYRAFMVYAAFMGGNLAATVTLTLGKDTKTYSVTLGNTPTMLSSTTTTAIYNYIFQDLGDFLFPRPGAIGIERTLTLSASDKVDVTFTGGTSFFLAGIFLVPSEQFISIDLGAATNTFNPIISNEGTSTKAQLASQSTGGQISTYQANGLLLELNSVNASATFASDEIELEPGDTHFETLAFNGSAGFSTSVYYAGLQTLGLDPTIIYAPRNLTGAV